MNIRFLVFTWVFYFFILEPINAQVCDTYPGGPFFCVEVTAPPPFFCYNIGDVIPATFRSNYIYQHVVNSFGVLVHESSTTVMLFKGNTIVWDSVLVDYTTSSYPNIFTIPISLENSLAVGGDYKVAIQGYYIKRHSINGNQEFSLFSYHEEEIFDIVDPDIVLDFSGINLQLVDLEETFTWSVAPNADRYRLVIQDSTTLTTIHDVTIVGNSYTIPENVLEFSSDYKIEVLAIYDLINPSFSCCLDAEFFHTIGPPLPVEIIEFNVVGQKGQIHLHWLTASEVGVAGYEIERSKDGLSFESIGWVTSISDQVENEYSFIDQGVSVNQTYYYRLMSVDLDVNFQFSLIKSVYLPGNVSVFVYPNPAKDHFFLDLSSFSEGCTLVTIVDQLGGIVYQNKVIGVGEGVGLRIDHRHFQFENGIYFIGIVDQDGKKHLKLVIENGR